MSTAQDSPGRAAEWLYRGLWGVLVRWFKVPEHPPELPARPGVTVERFHPSPAFVRYLKLWFWIGLAIVDGALLLAWSAIFFFGSHRLGLALAPVFLVAAVLPNLIGYVAIHLRYDSTWYLLSDRSLRIRRGIWTIRETTVTFENVQDVKIHQGPVERLFGIAHVIVATAGGGGKHGSEDGSGTSHTGLIEGVSDAARIRGLIMDRVRRSRTAGLGDEARETRRAERSPGRGWSPEHVAALREIRDAIAGLRRAGSP